MTAQTALETIKQALDAANQKGVFGNMETCVVVFQSLQFIANELNRNGSNSNAAGGSNTNSRRDIPAS